MSNYDNRQRPTGFNCPVCKGFIPIAMTQLLNAEDITCPHCRLEIRINKEGSRKAIDALGKVHEAEDQVRKASVFSR